MVYGGKALKNQLPFELIFVDFKGQIIHINSYGKVQLKTKEIYRWILFSSHLLSKFLKILEILRNGSILKQTNSL
jgi:IS30 family transposase